MLEAALASTRSGEVTLMRGPAACPASTARFTPRSMLKAVVPAVRMVVTPCARYRRGAVSGAGSIVHAGKILARRHVEQVVVHAHQAGNDRVARAIDHAHPGGDRHRRRRAECGDAPALDGRRRLVRSSGAAPVPSMTRTCVSATGPGSKAKNWRTSGP